MPRCVSAQQFRELPFLVVPVFERGSRAPRRVLVLMSGFFVEEPTIYSRLLRHGSGSQYVVPGTESRLACWCRVRTSSVQVINVASALKGLTAVQHTSNSQ